MSKIKVRWLIVAGGILLGALEAFSNIVLVSDMARAALRSDQPSSSGEELALDVLTYNASMGLLPSQDRDERILLTSKELGGHDLILLQGVQSEFHRKLLMTGLEDEYPHQSNVLGQDRLLKQDGGVVILSKWPIEKQRQTLFGDVCSGADCLTDAGVLYARINKQGRPFHVLATRLQSGSDNQQTREDQIRILKNKLNELSVQADEPVLIGGTLNVDRFADRRTGAFTQMLATLDATQPPPPRGGSHAPTVAPHENSLAAEGPAQHLDYLLYSAAHLRPVTASSSVDRIAAEGRYLSDHYAVNGQFMFKTAAQGEATANRSLVGVPMLADTSTLRIDGQIVRLLGVEGVTGAASEKMAGYLGEREITCRPAADTRYSCTVEGKDLSEVVLFNGGGRAAADAPPDHVQAERDAQQHRRGIWGQQPIESP
ncbi:MAG: endonuclease/exonuclease/phosphatase family protein [Pseudomonadota bacterium]